MRQLCGAFGLKTAGNAGKRKNTGNRCGRVSVFSVNCQRNNGFLVDTGTHLIFGENFVLGNPLIGAFKHFFSVWLEDKPLAGTPATSVHHCVKSFGKLLFVVMGVAFGAEVDITLRLPQRPKILSDVVRVRLVSNHRSNHEGSVDDFPKAKLLHEVVRAAEERSRWDFPVEQQLHALEQKSISERELYVRLLHVLLEGVNRGIVAS